MAIYQCKECECPIQGKEDNFCTQCGVEITEKVSANFLIEHTVKKWNAALIWYTILIAFGAVALIINSEKGMNVFVTLGMVGLVAGGVFLSIAGPFKVSRTVLVDKRNV